MIFIWLDQLVTNGIKVVPRHRCGGLFLLASYGVVCPFGHIISWDTTRTLCLHERCLSHPTSDKGELLDII